MQLQKAYQLRLHPNVLAAQMQLKAFLVTIATGAASTQATGILSMNKFVYFQTLLVAINLVSSINSQGTKWAIGYIMLAFFSALVTYYSWDDNE
jgi:hypothetical protein